MSHQTTNCVNKKQIENTCQIELYLGTMCWTCKCPTHYSRDCDVNMLKRKAKYVEIVKSKVSTQTIGSQIDLIVL